MRISDQEAVHRGFTRPELDKAFKAVHDPSDWKAPIESIVDRDDVFATLAAIEFFTATEAVVEIDGRDLVIRSIGYRAGPAGDH